jgi:hypothetical protein
MVDGNRGATSRKREWQSGQHTAEVRTGLSEVMWTTAAFGDVVEVVEVESGGCLEGVEDFSLTRR